MDQQTAFRSNQQQTEPIKRISRARTIYYPECQRQAQQWGERFSIVRFALRIAPLVGTSSAFQGVASLVAREGHWLHIAQRGTYTLPQWDAPRIRKLKRKARRNEAQDRATLRARRRAGA